eukprot:scaffold2990_cov239-Chaetoceros_neogracile.AAC.2
MGWDVREVWVGVSKQHQERCTRWRTTSPTPNPTGTAATNSNVLLYSCCYKNSMSVGRQEGGEKKEKATRSVAKNNERRLGIAVIQEVTLKDGEKIGKDDSNDNCKSDGDTAPQRRIGSNSEEGIETNISEIVAGSTQLESERLNAESHSSNDEQTIIEEPTAQKPGAFQYQLFVDGPGTAFQTFPRYRLVGVLSNEVLRVRVGAVVLVLAFSHSFSSHCGSSDRRQISSNRSALMSPTR